MSPEARAIKHGMAITKMLSVPDIGISERTNCSGRRKADRYSPGTEAGSASNATVPAKKQAEPQE